MLENYLSTSCLRYIESTQNWEEAIRIGSSQLIVEEKISEKYVDQMIENIKKLGPYIVIAPSIALAHSRPSEYVYQDCISITVFDKPVVFNNIENDPVRLLFVFAAKENNNHINLIKEISYLLDNSNVLSRLLSAKGTDEIKSLLNL
ncbi:PTS sugar transporter subunit IIA [Vibrio hepatarius]|uniref:PTS sugar transporter subunit IIA n=1 Tax=Vibrio hepatarius TaxID=171383 RepID=UPI00142E05FA|nr:PTS sugar transporter subunit IIA [Vibrio hepatarius]NIY83706.1 PTS sugar transporter subunit IIA [Vibrio hepatarius]